MLGEKASANGLESSVTVLTHLPVQTSHSLTEQSLAAEASHWPSESTHTLCTMPL